MTDYNQLIVRNGGGTTPDARQIPDTVEREVVSAIIEQSAALNLFRVQQMPALVNRIPVLNSYPTSYWQNGATQADKDSALKKTTTYTWDNVYMQAEEIAVLVPVPDAYVADTGVDLLQEVKPLLAAEFGRRIDAAVFFGTELPASWTTGNIYAGAVAAGNSTVLGTGSDVGIDVAVAAEHVGNDGFNVDAFITRPGFKWTARKARGTDGQPIYDSNTNQLYGETFQEVRNGAWDTTKAQLIAGDFSMGRIGIRQDLTFEIFNSGVITDQSGAVTYNAMQQDGKILRAVMRVAFAVAAPTVTQVNQVNPYPFAVVRTAGGPLS